MLNPAMERASRRRRSSPAVSTAITGAPMSQASGDQVTRGRQANVQVWGRAGNSPDHRKTFGANREGTEGLTRGGVE